MRLMTVAVGVLASVALVAGADASPTSFQLVFDGHHIVATFPTPTGLSHEGVGCANSDRPFGIGAFQSVSETMRVTRHPAQQTGRSSSC
jgi:hypothetical protein